jgi:hypothetical protein
VSALLTRESSRVRCSKGLGCSQAALSARTCIAPITLRARRSTTGAARRSPNAAKPAARMLTVGVQTVASNPALRPHRHGPLVKRARDAFLMKDAGAAGRGGGAQGP